MTSDPAAHGRPTIGPDAGGAGSGSTPRAPRGPGVGSPILRPMADPTPDDHRRGRRHRRRRRGPRLPHDRQDPRPTSAARRAATKARMDADKGGSADGHRRRPDRHQGPPGRRKDARPRARPARTTPPAPRPGARRRPRPSGAPAVQAHGRGGRPQGGPQPPRPAAATPRRGRRRPTPAATPPRSPAPSWRARAWVPVIMFGLLGIGHDRDLPDLRALGRSTRSPSASGLALHPRRHPRRHPVPLIAGPAATPSDQADRPRTPTGEPAAGQRDHLPGDEGVTQGVTLPRVVHTWGQRRSRALRCRWVSSRSMSSMQWRGGSGSSSFAAVMRTSVPQIEHR